MHFWTEDSSLLYDFMDAFDSHKSAPCLSLFWIPINFKLIKDRCVWVIEGSRLLGWLFRFVLLRRTGKAIPISNTFGVYCASMGKPMNQENKFFRSNRSIWPALALCKIVFVRKNLGSLIHSQYSMGCESSNNAQSGNGMLCFALDDARAKKGS